MFNSHKLGLTSLVLAVCALGSLSCPASSLAHDPMYPKLGFHFRLALAGDLESHTGNSPRRTVGMEPGFGGGVELELPITVHFSLGGAFEAYGWTAGSASDSYNVGLDFLFMPRVRIPFGSHPWHAEVYFGLPIGPTVSLPHDRFANAMGALRLDTGVGVTGGGRVGFRINVNEVVGFFADVGPMIQYVSFPTGSGGPSLELWHYQLVLRAGGTFGMGA